MAARGGSTPGVPTAAPAPPRLSATPEFLSPPSSPPFAESRAPRAERRLPVDSGAHLGLRPWGSPEGRGSVLYAEAGGYRVTAGHPRVASAELAAWHAGFLAACRRAGARVLHFGLTSGALEFIPESAGRSRWHVGDLPVFDLARWRDDRTVPRAVRTQARRAAHHGVTVSRWAHAPADPVLRERLRVARTAWLAAKALPPLAFLTTPDLFDPWPHDGVFVAETAAGIVGFLVASRALHGDLYRIDAVARVPGAPNGTPEFLVREAFGWAARNGVAHATLGLAPLSRRSRVRQRGWLAAVSWCARRVGGGLYSFAGLEAFKAKFAPDAWVPLYAVVPGRAFGVRDVMAVARVFAGGSLARYAWRAALRARAH